MDYSDEHLLNFKERFIESLPDWFENRNYLSLICGPGDYVHNGMTNIEQFNTYDIFCCYGDYGDTGSDSSYASVEENLNYLVDNFYQEKILCLIDLTDENQIQNFLALFNNKIVLLTSQDAHSPMFNPTDAYYLLIDGGIAVPKPGEKRTYNNSIRTLYRYGKYAEANNLGFSCKFDSFIEPSGKRKYKDAYICTKKDYSEYNGGKRIINKKRKIRKTRKLRKTINR